MVSCGLGPCKGVFCYGTSLFASCRKQCKGEKGEERRGAVIKSGARFGTCSRYWMAVEREERQRELL